jgi:hypothetical protein
MKAILFAGAMAAAAVPAVAQDAGMKEQGGVRWICGGVGEEARAELAALRPQANLELLFITGKRGGYIADVGLALYAGEEKAPLLRTVSPGPICLLAVPAGRYRIEAEFRGVTRVLRAGTGGKAPVVFSFPEEP